MSGSRPTNGPTNDPTNPPANGSGDASRRSLRRNKLGEIASISSALRATGEPIASRSQAGAAPDFTNLILARVDAERPFLNHATRRAVWASRVGLGVSAAVLVLGVALTLRFAPKAVELAPAPAPLSAVVDTLGTGAEYRLQSIRAAVSSAGNTPPSRVLSNVTGVAPSSALDLLDMSMPVTLAPLGQAGAQSGRGDAVRCERLRGATQACAAEFEIARGVDLLQPRAWAKMPNTRAVASSWINPSTGRNQAGVARSSSDDVQIRMSTLLGEGDLSTGLSPK